MPIRPSVKSDLTGNSSAIIARDFEDLEPSVRQDKPIIYDEPVTQDDPQAMALYEQGDKRATALDRVLS